MLMTYTSQPVKSEMLKAALDALATGVVFTTHGGHVIYMNASAARQIKSGTALRLFNNRISPIDADAARTLTSVLASTASDRPGAMQHTYSFALPDCDGMALFVTIVPLEGVERQDADRMLTATAAIFIQDPSALPRCPGRAFAKLYNLTKGELRVALAMLPGLTLQEVAWALDLSLQTVKTHLQHIFQKTGTARQAELMALMLRASSPLMLLEFPG